MKNSFKAMEETIESVGEYLGGVVAGLKIISEHIQTGREDKALTMSIDLIDGLKWLSEAFELTRPLQEFHGCIINTSELKDLLTPLVEAFENSDYVMLSDILEYELSPLVGDWDKTVKELLLKTGDTNEQPS